MTPLERAVAIVAFKDAQPFRQSVFDELSGRRPAIALARRAHQALGGSWLSTALVAAYGARAYLGVRAPSSPSDVLAVGEYANERRQFDWLAGLLAGRTMAHADLGMAGLLDPASWRDLATELTRPGQVFAALRLLRRHDGPARADFLVAARVAATIGYYARFRRALRRKRPGAVLVSSDSNPAAMGAAWAARAAGVPTIYVNHGHIPDDPPRATFDLILLDGPALLRVYEDSHGVDGDVVFKGVEGVTAAMDTSGARGDAPRVGVFLSLVTDWPGLRRALDAMRTRLRPREVLIRLHPNRAVRDAAGLASLGLGEDTRISDASRPLLADGADCDLVIAGGSSAHLTLLKAGIPTVCVPGIDHVPHDFYRFQRERIVAASDRVEDIDPSAVADFYDDPDWAARFARFDAGYPDADRDDAVRAAVEALLTGGAR